MYEQGLAHVQLKPSKVKLQTYNGGRLRVVVVDVKYKPAVMGRNWLTRTCLDWTSLFRVKPATPMDRDPTEEFPELFVDSMGTLKGYEAKI